MKTFSERIKSASEAKGVIQADIARACGISTAAVADWFSGKTKSLKGDNLLKASSFLCVSPNWLSTGQGQMRTAPVIDLDTVPDLVRIRRMSNRVYAGIDGFAVHNDEMESAKPAYVFLSWVKSRKFAPEKLITFFVEGNCMEPNLWAGDQIIINMDDKEPQDGVVFAVRYEGILIAKRLRRNAGQWWLDSDNPDKSRYAPKLFTEDAQIVGRVVYRRTEVI